MLAKKIVLTPRIRNLIIDSRKSARQNNSLLTADYISEKIGRAKSWLSQVENGRLQSVKTSDLVNVFCCIQGKDKDCEEDRNQVKAYLDDQIQYILVTEKLDIIDTQGNIKDFSKMLSFQSARNHIKFAGEKLTEIFYELLNTPITDIQAHLKKHIKYIFYSVIDWFNRAFNDTAELFSDELSTINLYLLIETSLNIYNGNYEYFGLNPLNISSTDLAILKEKLNTDFFIKGKTIVKPLNEYSSSEIDDVITNFTTEEYMLWKNKHTYIGNAVLPMIVNYKDSNSFIDNYVYYDDLNNVTELTRADYLYIIKQIYTQVDILFKRCKTLLEENKDLEDENDDLFSENQKITNELNNLKEQDS